MNEEFVSWIESVGSRYCDAPARRENESDGGDSPRAASEDPIVATYNEVADELVSEYLEEQARLTGQRPDDEKNIRAAYDALNVLMAMDIISKEKKEIKWCGLPSYADSDLDVASRDVDRARKSVARKRRHIIDDADVLKRLKLHEPQPDEPPPPDERARTDSEVKMPPPLPVIEPPKPAESA
ncbi:hypothetical protein JL722_2539 [Aureococcus anophagefferens]|nr:hypothetical protein JL722_2539 [Aureococcus anophagefferens]